MHAIAEESAKSDQGQSGTSQGSSSNSSSKNQNQANDTTSSNKDSQSGSAQSNQNTSNSQNKAKRDNDQQGSQNRSDQNRDDRSDRNSTAERSSSSTTDRDRNNTRGRDSERSDRDDRNRDDRTNTRDRSGRNDDRNDNRAHNSDRDSSREHSARRDNTRGPDIGIWFNRSSRDGLVISDVATRGPIAKLGFREGDRIVSVNGHRITREDEFMRYLLQSDSRRVTVIVLRDNREQTIYVEPAVLVDDRDYSEVDPLERFGIVLDDRYDDRIVVWRVIPRSPAYYAGFRPGDVIVTFSGRPYRTRTEFETGSRSWKTGDANVQIRRGDKTRELSVEIPNADRSDRRSEQSQVRDARAPQREAAPADQGNTNQNDQNAKDKNSNDQRNNNNGGILNNLRPRGNR